MDIPALSIALSSMEVMNSVGVAVLSQNLDVLEQTGSDLTKLMEASVTPHLGQNIDITV